MKTENPIPAHLRGYITEAIKSGLREPKEIMEAAIGRCNDMANEMIEGTTSRSQKARNELYTSVYAKSNN